ncbi:radical SAM protein [Enterococcus silesiacus]|uniref:Radical SAM protein n=1 Tax=Enterococcus silesiacus TaxID=332949 RepID=A0A0S3KD74_9ENTE|nr:radical SAM protein [Enterococcus silesiacus]ALS02256.1 radical SAM protein [Enterococcus silesiacus]OJG92385.1 hypothetical protein RV15_GL003178 [Enterococcus silesiacus]
MDYISAKSILSKSRTNEWFGTDYTMNLYKGCHHGCVYCDSRSECYQIDHFEKVRGKKQAIEILSKELSSKKKKGIVGTGSMSDPYNFFERSQKLTLRSLELFHHFGYGVSIATKSSLVTRDHQLLERIAQHSPVNVSLSVSTMDDELAKKIERAVSLPSQRLEAVRQLATSGIYTGVILMPMLPFLTDDWSTIELVVLKAAEAGAKYVYPFFGMTLRDRQKEHYFTFLAHYFPEILMKYKENYDRNYFCGIQNQAQITSKFYTLCDKLGMDYQMEKIIHNYQAPYVSNQGTLFD